MYSHKLDKNQLKTHIMNLFLLVKLPEILI